jgi:hypothetical protein
MFIKIFKSLPQRRKLSIKVLSFIDLPKVRQEFVVAPGVQFYC